VLQQIDRQSSRALGLVVHRQKRCSVGEPSNSPARCCCEVVASVQYCSLGCLVDSFPAFRRSNGFTTRPSLVRLGCIEEARVAAQRVLDQTSTIHGFSVAVGQGKLLRPWRRQKSSPRRICQGLSKIAKPGRPRQQPDQDYRFAHLWMCGSSCKMTFSSELWISRWPL
jgi:hypothetical protein